MKTKTRIILIVILLAMLVGISFIRQPKVKISDSAAIFNSSEIYTNPAYGFSFEYPSRYSLIEKDLSSPERKHYLVILIDKSTLTEIASEGPTSINIDIYQNNLDKQSVENWIKNTSESNFKLSNGVLTPIQVANTPSLSFTWDGLYRGRTTVFENNQNIIAVSGTYLETTDPIFSDYEKILSSFKFLAPQVSGKLPQTLVENYLKENISNISTQKEVLGGKFYVTEVILDYGGKGIVKYEDGHNAYMADFNYGIVGNGEVEIKNFSIRK